MFLKFFWIPALDSGVAEQELNAFLSRHRVVDIDRQFAVVGSVAGWSLCVQWVGECGEAGVAEKRGGRNAMVDYRVILDEPTFRIFAALREWRKEKAAAEGVPIYTIASNEQLAVIARRRIRTKAGLQEVEGFGAGRMDRYADPLLAVCLREMEGSEPQA